MLNLNDLKIHIYADGADKAGILELYAKPYIKGLTTNPTLMNKAGIKDIEKHFQGKTIRVRGAIAWCAYDGFGTPPEVEVVVDDLSHLEVLD